ncbi:MAG: hypothetical protein IPK80_29095 [Nannocystis sp.]|nr:hypothetical protein [Nannocystis sp.]
MTDELRNAGFTPFHKDRRIRFDVLQEFASRLPDDDAEEFLASFIPDLIDGETNRTALWFRKGRTDVLPLMRSLTEEGPVDVLLLAWTREGHGDDFRLVFRDVEVPAHLMVAAALQLAEVGQ